MSNTDLYYAKLTDLSVRIRVGIGNRREPLNELTKALDQLSQTNAIKGKAADAMKAYIGEVHMTLIQTLGLILYNYEAPLDNYVIGYLGVDSDKGFQLVKEDLDDHERKLSSHRSDFTSFGNKLKAISDEAEDIISLSGAGSRSIVNVVSEMDAMKKTVSNLKENWNKYDNSYKGFDQVENLITQTASLLNSTLSAPRTYSYSPGSFRNLMSKNFVDALIANANYAQNPANQKVFNANRNKILKNYKDDQKRMAEEANRHKGAWEVVFGVGAVVIGVVAIVATAGAATPLVAVAYASGFSAIAYGTSNAFEGSQIMVTGADKAFNPLRDTVFQGNQSAYDTFGNVSMFVAGSVIPVGAALKAGEPVTRAFIGGVGRTSVTTAVGAVTNFVVAPIATSLAKSAGIDPIVANDIGIGTGLATSIFTAGKAYKACGTGAEVEELGNAERLKYYEKLKDGVIDDTAWSKLSKYAEEEEIDLNNIPWDEKMSMIDKFKSDIMTDADSMKYVENNANELLKLSDIRLRECIEKGYNAKEYYKILNQDKTTRNPKKYLKSLKNTKLIKNWNEAFYGNDSKVVLSYMPKDAYDNFVLGHGTIGRAGKKGGQFVLPQRIGDSIEAKLADLGSISNATPEFKVQLAKELGLPKDVFANGVVRVEVPLDGGIDLQMVKGIEDGCNYQWIPGGKTLGGTTEGIIRQITKDNDTELYNTIISNVKK